MNSISGEGLHVPVQNYYEVVLEDRENYFQEEKLENSVQEHLRQFFRDKSN